MYEISSDMSVGNSRKDTTEVEAVKLKGFGVAVREVGQESWYVMLGFLEKIVCGYMWCAVGVEAQRSRMWAAEPSQVECLEVKVVVLVDWSSGWFCRSEQIEGCHELGSSQVLLFRCGSILHDMRLLSKRDRRSRAQQAESKDCSRKHGESSDCV